MNEGYSDIRLPNVQSGKYSTIRQVSEAADRLHHALYRSGALMDNANEEVDYALMMAAASRNLGETKKILSPIWPDISRRLFSDVKMSSGKKVDKSYATLADFLKQ